jgi:DNA-directed RNA polymerase subunit K/omega
MLPVYKIVDFTKNRYLLAKAEMIRARQINFLGDDKLDDFGGKIVSLSLQEILDGEIKYKLNPVKK